MVFHGIGRRGKAGITKEILERCLRYINWKREFEENLGWN